MGAGQGLPQASLQHLLHELQNHCGESLLTNPAKPLAGLFLQKLGEFCTADATSHWPPKLQDEFRSMLEKNLAKTVTGSNNQISYVDIIHNFTRFGVDLINADLKNEKNVTCGKEIIMGMAKIWYDHAKSSNILPHHLIPVKNVRPGDALAAADFIREWSFFTDPGTGIDQQGILNRCDKIFTT